MTDGKRTLIDTNIIIYSIDNSSDYEDRSDIHDRWEENSD